MDRRIFLAAGTAATLAPSLGLAESHAAAEGAMAGGMAPDAVVALGAEDAPVTLVEYASFTCPHCKRFHEGVLPGIKADYVETGQVRFEYREVFFDRYGLWAAMIARCGGEARYMPIADMIYARQSEWTQGEPAEVAENLMRIGVAAGLSREEVEACLQDAEQAQGMVELWEARREEDGVSSTPNLVIGGQNMGALSEADLRAALDAALEG